MGLLILSCALPGLAEALQMHSALFLDDAEVTVPVTPTSGFAGFWRGSEVGEMPTPTSTSEVVKSKYMPSVLQILSCPLLHTWELLPPSSFIWGPSSYNGLTASPRLWLLH